MSKTAYLQWYVHLCPPYCRYLAFFNPAQLQAPADSFLGEGDITNVTSRMTESQSFLNKSNKSDVASRAVLLYVLLSVH